MNGREKLLDLDSEHTSALRSNLGACMPRHPTDLAKDVRGDSATFENFMRKLVQVPHSEIKAALDAEKEMKRKPFSVFRVPRAASKKS